jgi:hypothetical protein
MPAVFRTHNAHSRLVGRPAEGRTNCEGQTRHVNAVHLSGGYGIGPECGSVRNSSGAAQLRWMGVPPSLAGAKGDFALVIGFLDTTA